VLQGRFEKNLCEGETTKVRGSKSRRREKGQNETHRMKLTLSPSTYEDNRSTRLWESRRGKVEQGQSSDARLVKFRIESLQWRLGLPSVQFVNLPTISSWQLERIVEVSDYVRVSNETDSYRPISKRTRTPLLPDVSNATLRRSDTCYCSHSRVSFIEWQRRG